MIATEARGAMFMAEQVTEITEMIDAALRRQVAQWTRESLGELVEDEAVAAPIVMRYSRGRDADQRCGGTQVSKKEWCNAYSCGRRRAAAGVFTASRPAGGAPHRRSCARWA